MDRDIRFEVIARLCPNTTGAELRSVCTEAGMYAIRCVAFFCLFLFVCCWCGLSSSVPFPTPHTHTKINHA